jgi:hypothetical protein
VLPASRAAFLRCAWATDLGQCVAGVLIQFRGITMSVVQVTLTAEQLAAAYTQLNAQERRTFLAEVFSQPAQQQAALELLVEAQAALRRKFSPQQQRQLNRLLHKNATGKLRSAERQQLDELLTEYGEGLLDKARASYLLHLAQQAETTSR